MNPDKRAGRVVGVLLLLQFVCGLTLPFILLKEPLSIAPPGFLVSAAANAFQVHLAVLIAFLGGALTVGIAIVAWPVFRGYSQRMALWLLVLCAISLAMDSLHNATVMSMLSLSQRYTEAEGANTELFEALAATVRSARYWVHYTQLLFVGGWIFMFYTIMLRFALVPRVLAALGLVGITLQFAGVTLAAWLDYRSVMELAMPLAPIQVTVAVWLMVRGLKERRLPVGSETRADARPVL